MNISEEQMTRWAKSPSETEEGKCRVAVERITETIKERFGDSVRIFLQGSYKNRTNVRFDSDVDIVACYTEVYYPDTTFLSDEETKIFHSLTGNSDYKFSQYKDEIESLLRSEFEYGEVERKEKCIKVKGNNSRINADVVPAFLHKRLRTADPNDSHTEGIQFFTEAGQKISSFPDHHYNNGVQKNADTEQMYKSVVRILKNIRNELVEQGKIATKAMPSFSLECLVWNVLPHSHFQKSTYCEAVKEVIEKVWNDMRNQSEANNYAEVSDLLWLFRGNVRITPKQAEDFMLQAWNFIGYEN